MNKKAIELSINFIVMLILSIVVFGMGMFFLSGFFDLASDQTDQLDITTEKMIEGMLFDGSKVAVPIDKKEIQRGISAVFGVGILNVEPDDATFRIEMKQSLYVDKFGVKQDDAPTLDFLPNINRTILVNEQEIMGIPVRVSGDALSGTYIIDLDVYVGDRKYFNTIQITIKVP